MAKKSKKVVEETKQEEFLKELTKLSLKYGITIGGCGCCGSPYLKDHTDGGSRYEADEHGDLTWG